MMKMGSLRIVLSALAVTALLGSTVAMASAEGAGHAEGPGLLSFDIGSAFWNLLIFLLTFAVLSKFVWPHILSGLSAREEKIRGDLEAAEQANAKAQSLLSDYQSKLNAASTQVQTMLAEARRDAEASGDKIVSAAKAEAERQRERAIADIETAKKVAMADLAGATSKLAMTIASNVVGRELRSEDHADLIRQSLDRVPSQN
jgi:F-type H+-transporting ATPase subunit b